MDPITQQAVLATAGAAAGGPKVYVDDVFSTYLYEGNDSTNQIINGIDLAGEGGLVWLKSRGSAHSHSLYDSGQGDFHYMMSNSTASSYDLSTYYSGYGLTSFNNNGFTLGANYNYENANGADFVSWTFRKAPGFFDVVTYTGNGSNQTIPHSLGSVPGMIIIKRLNGTGDWWVYHRSIGTGDTSRLNLDGGFLSYTSPPTFPWNNTTPTSTVFSVGANATYKANTLNETYVAYIFAHDEPVFGTGGNESIIKCGSYTGDASTPGPIVNLGWEPQWVLIKSSSTGAWLLWDSMRGINDSGSSNYLMAESTDAEAISTGAWGGLRLTPTGFQVDGNGGWMNDNGVTYTYMAIRRPHKPPTAATDVFSVVRQVANSATFQTGFPVDWTFSMPVLSQPAYGITRLTGDKYLTLGSDAAEGSTGTLKFDDNEAFAWGPFWLANVITGTFFRRAPGFFDIVTYSGTGVNNAVNHNLKVTPEFVIIKDRHGTSATDWICWHKDLTSTDPYIFLNNSAAEAGYGASWIAPSSTALNLTYTNYINVASNKYVAYLFATLSGISKVGSYTGTGNAINVDCGFAAGARLVLIKRTDSTGDWYVWTSADGIVSGDDPYYMLNDTAGTRTTDTDYIDPLTSGFTVTSSAPAALNVSGGTYLFLAIA